MLLVLCGWIALLGWLEMFWVETEQALVWPAFAMKRDKQTHVSPNHIDGKRSRWTHNPVSKPYVTQWIRVQSKTACFLCASIKNNNHKALQSVSSADLLLDKDVGISLLFTLRMIANMMNRHLTVSIAIVGTAWMTKTTDAFTMPSTVSSSTGNRRLLGPTSTTQLFDEPDDGTFVKSVFQKEIAYDEKSGRFFETNFEEGDCVPDEEYCITDKDSGEMIRLTVEEKERIFLDALQVSYLYLQSFCTQHFI